LRRLFPRSFAVSVLLCSTLFADPSTSKVFGGDFILRVDGVGFTRGNTLPTCGKSADAFFDLHKTVVATYDGTLVVAGETWNVDSVDETSVTGHAHGLKDGRRHEIDLFLRQLDHKPYAIYSLIGYGEDGDEACASTRGYLAERIRKTR